MSLKFFEVLFDHFNLILIKCLPIFLKRLTRLEVKSLAFELPRPQTPYGGVGEELGLVRSIWATSERLFHYLKEWHVLVEVFTQMSILIQKYAENWLVRFVDGRVYPDSIQVELAHPVGGCGVGPPVPFQPMDL